MIDRQTGDVAGGGRGEELIVSGGGRYYMGCRVSHLSCKYVSASDKNKQHTVM